MGHNKITAAFLFGLGLGLVIAWMVDMVFVGWESYRPMSERGLCSSASLAQAADARTHIKRKGPDDRGL